MNCGWNALGTIAMVASAGPAFSTRTVLCAQLSVAVSLKGVRTD